MPGSAPSRSIIVANRLPVTVRIDEGQATLIPSVGGLATAMKPCHEAAESLWIGWPGETSALGAGEKAQLDESLRAKRMVPVHLGRKEVEKFYEGFSNGVLWPLFHYSLERVRLDAWKDWEAYRDVNAKFADAITAIWRPGDHIWVHDYQLALLPGCLRKRLPEASIGYFLHIPFPSSSVFRILPWRRELLEGLLGADLIGFQTFSFQRHFISTLLRTLGLEAKLDVVEFEGRVVRVGAFPISIDTTYFATAASQPAVKEAATVIRENHPGCQLVLGVDRLDYTKGLQRRVLAIERLLERAPHLIERFKFIQVAVPSREGVEAYGVLRRQIEELIGRVNGRFSTVNWSPIRYLYRSVDENELLALYRAADVMLVTPLRDGMNLVAKEFIACQVEHDGVLVLSEFAGASWELGEALLVNPYDVDQSALAIQEALEMPQEARAYRMKMLRHRLRQWPVQRWTAEFMEALITAGAENVRRHRATTLPETEIERLLAAPCVALVLDYDGTLMPFAPAPELARPDDALLELVRRLAVRSDRRVHIASGRDRDTLGRWFTGLDVSLFAEHGFFSRADQAGSWKARTIPLSDWKPSVRAVLERFAEHTPGSFVEDKAVALCWHYRRAEPQLAASQVRELRLHLAELLANQPAEVINGAKVVEVRQAGVHKGLIVPDVLASAPEGAIILAIGDDTTDEDLFKALPPGAVSIHVGSRSSAARYRLPDPASVRALLERFTG